MIQILNIVFIMIAGLCVRLQELIKLRNLEQKHEPMKSLLLDIDFRLVCLICYHMSKYIFHTHLHVCNNRSKKHTMCMHKHPKNAAPYLMSSSFWQRDPPMKMTEMIDMTLVVNLSYKDRNLLLPQEGSKLWEECMQATSDPLLNRELLCFHFKVVFINVYF